MLRRALLPAVHPLRSAAFLAVLLPLSALALTPSADAVVVCVPPGGTLACVNVDDTCVSAASTPVPTSTVLARTCTVFDPSDVVCQTFVAGSYRSGEWRGNSASVCGGRCFSANVNANGLGPHCLY